MTGETATVGRPQAIEVVAGTPGIVYEDEHIRMEQRFVPLEHRGGRLLDYVVTVGKEASLQETWYSGGYLDVARSCENRIGLARQLAGFGLGLVIVKNDRSIPSVRNPQTGNKDAMLTHAWNALSVVEAEGLQRTTLPTMGFSAGGMVVPLAIREARTRGWSCFDEANVALVAAAGVNPNETPASLARRFLGSALMDILGYGAELDSEAAQAMEYTVSAGSKAFRRNPGRAVREWLELGIRKTNLLELAASVGQLAIAVHGQDRTSPARLSDTAVAELYTNPDVPANVSYFMPYSTEPDPSGRPLGIRNAQHLDCITNTARVANPVGRFLGQTA